MRVLTAMLATVALQGPVAAESLDAGSFGKWQVSCDPTLHCVAQTTVSPGGAEGVFAVGRHAQEIWWELAFRPVAPADEWADFAVSVDGTVTMFSGRAEVGAYGSANHFFLLGRKAQEVLDRLVPGAAAQVDYSARDGSARTATFELDGLAAALIFIDERQRRLGSERVAAGPPIGLTPAGSEQVAISPVPADLIERRRGEPDCAALEELPNGRDFQVGEVGSGASATTVYIVPCNGGAYNFSSAVYTGGDGEYVRQAFAEYWPSSGLSGVTELFGANLDPETGSITTFYRSRGIGDCGSTALYQWTGTTFRLDEFRAKEECDGAEGEFPLVYRSEESQPMGRGPRARQSQ